MSYIWTLEVLKGGDWLFSQASHSPFNSCSTALKPRKCLARGLHPNRSADVISSPKGNYLEDPKCKETRCDQDTTMTHAAFRSCKILLHSKPAPNPVSLPAPPAPWGHVWSGHWLTPNTYCSALVPLTALDNSLISVQASRFAVYKQPKWGSPWMFRRQSIQYRALGFHTFSLLIDCPSCSSILSGLPGPHHSSITLSAFPAALSPLSHYSPTSPWLCVCVFTVPCAGTTSHSFLCTQHRSQVSTKCSVFAEYPVIIF